MALTLKCSQHVREQAAWVWWCRVGWSQRGGHRPRVGGGRQLIAVYSPVLRITALMIEMDCSNIRRKGGRDNRPIKIWLKSSAVPPSPRKAPFHEMRAFSLKGEAKGAFRRRGEELTRLRRSFCPSPRGCEFAATRRKWPFFQRDELQFVRTK